jgi:hypothetical protein
MNVRFSFKMTTMIFLGKLKRNPVWINQIRF